MLTLASLLQSTALTHGHRVALREDHGTTSWRSYVDRIARTASLLRAWGLAPGERFGLLCRNAVIQAQLLNAGYWAGVVPVPLNFRLAPVEIADLLADAGCRRLVVDRGLRALLDHDALASWRAAAVEVDLDGGDDGLAAAIAAQSPLAPHPSDEHDDALLLYTGGTTGRSKGVRLSHRNVMSNALQLSRVMSPTEDDVYLHVSPMFHSTDLKSTVVTMFGGGHVYLKEFSAAGVLGAVERHRVTILSLVPTMIVRLLREGVRAGRLDACDLSSLRLISYGTSPIDEGVLREAMAAFPNVGFHQCYGLTETSPLLAILDEAAHRRALVDRPELLRAAGRPLPGVTMRFVDDEGRDVKPGEAGELVVRGPQVTAGYLHRQDDNAEAFRDGWFHTGDIARIDDAGYLHVLGRRKDMVITGGENVYTREVERVLEQHPRVREVAVVGVPDAQYGEALLGVIVLDDAQAGEPGHEELIAFCRTRLGGFKIPRRYRFVAELPRTSMGKVRKHELAKAQAELLKRSTA
jgi:long-chain acyl-CoA synthetase